MGHNVKSFVSSSSSKSEQSKCSMHKGSMSVPRKRKIKRSSSSDQAKKRRAIRSGAEAQSRPTPLDTDRTRLSERQQIALVLEESKRTAAAERVQKHHSKRKAAQESDDASDSEQDSVSEDEPAIKDHRRPVKTEQPAESLVSQHSDVASQLGKHKHQLYARNGRLESLSGGSKQSRSSSKARQTVASQPESPAPELQRVESDAESHPAHSHNRAADSSKQQPSPERQRTSDVSSRDVLEAMDDMSRVKDESQSQDFAAVRLPLKEDGMDLVNLRTQRLALRQASSQMLQSSVSGALPRLDKLKHSRSDHSLPDGMSASPQHPFGKLKIRTKREDSLKHHHHIGSAESPAALDGFQSSKTKGNIQTPRQLDHRHSDLTPHFTSAHKQQHSLADATPRSWHLQQRQSAPMAELVESDLFGDLAPSRSGLEPRPSGPVTSPRVQSQPAFDVLASSSQNNQHLSEAGVPKALSLPRAGVKVTLKQHRLAVTDGCRVPVREETSAVLAVQPPTPAIQVPAAEEIRCDPDDRPEPAHQQQQLNQPQLEQQAPHHQQHVQQANQAEAQLDPVLPAPTKKRKPVKQGRGRPSLTFLRAVSQDASLRMPASEPAEKMRPSDATMQTASPLTVPETDARSFEPSAPAARGRGRMPKPPKRASTLTALGRKGSRSVADEDQRGPSSAAGSQARYKGLTLLAACSLLCAQEATWASATQRCHSDPVHHRLDPLAQPSTDAAAPSEACTGTQSALHDAAVSTLSDLRQRHQLEGNLQTASMVAASEAADKGNNRWQHPRSKAVREIGAEASGAGAGAGARSFRSTCSLMWAPLQPNRDADQLFASKKWTQEELTSQDPRSPRRTASHRTYDSGWDACEARQNCELQTLTCFQQWCVKQSAAGMQLSQ